jgi:hypothetical protein
VARFNFRKLAAPLGFQPDRVAYFEAAGWRAYYDRKWLALAWLIVRVCQEQFRIPLGMSLIASYYIARASIAWAPLDHDQKVVAEYYAKFYRIAKRYSHLHFDPDRAGELEMRYNDDHRRLAGKPDKSAFIQTMVELHGELFGLTPDQARESAELRVEACNAVDRITGRTSTDVEAHWALAEAKLGQCYRSIERLFA